MVNPVILSEVGTQNGSEGCLSVPGVYGEVERPNKVTAEAYDRNGRKFKITGEGLLARAFCHEIEHLDGILFSSHVDEFVEISKEK